MSISLYRYDVAISFSGEDRPVAERLAEALRDRGLHVFYDRFEASGLWGRDLVEYLAEVYGEQSRFCVVLISKSYPLKQWPRFELKWVHSKQLESFQDYILPLRLDDTKIPGLPPVIGHLDLRHYPLEFVVEAVIEKLKSSPRIWISGPTAPKGIHLSRLQDISLSTILNASEAIISVEKIRSVHDGDPGCNLVLNDGKQVERLWATLAPTGSSPRWAHTTHFQNNKARATSVSGAAYVWLSNGKIWFKTDLEQNPSQLDIPGNDTATHVAILETPTRLAVATKKSLFLFDYAKPELMARVATPNDFASFDSVWFANDGRLITAKYASQVIWDNSSLRKLLDLDDLGVTASYVVNANGFDSTGRYFAACAMSDQLVVVDTVDNKLITNVELPGKTRGWYRYLKSPLKEAKQDYRYDYRGLDLAYHPEYTNILVAVNGGGEIILWNGVFDSVEVLVSEGGRLWTTCFFPHRDIFAAVDSELRCACWRVDYVA
jgi:hypothetical protein